MANLDDFPWETVSCRKKIVFQADRTLAHAEASWCFLVLDLHSCKNPILWVLRLLGTGWHARVIVSEANHRINVHRVSHGLAPTRDAACKKRARQARQNHLDLSTSHSGSDHVGELGPRHTAIA